MIHPICKKEISTTNLEISKIGIEIGSTQKKIELNHHAIEETMQALNQTDDESMVELLLQYDNLSEFWGKIDELEQLRSVMREKLANLTSQKEILNAQFETNTNKRDSLVSLKEQYADQNEVLVGSKSEKSKLLSATKNEEAQYQKLLKPRKP